MNLTTEVFVGRVSGSVTRQNEAANVGLQLMPDPIYNTLETLNRNLLP